MRAPVVAVGDGSPGFFKAPREVFPETKQNRGWWHRMVNVHRGLTAPLRPRTEPRTVLLAGGGLRREPTHGRSGELAGRVRLLGAMPYAPAMGPVGL